MSEEVKNLINTIDRLSAILKRKIEEKKNKKENENGRAA